MAVWIISRNIRLNLMPLLYVPVIKKIVFICHRPPDIRICRKTPQRIIKIPQIILLRHMAVPPSVIGMKKNQIHLNSHVEQPVQLCLKILPEIKIRSVRVKRLHSSFAAKIIMKYKFSCIFRFVERKMLRFIFIVLIVFGKHTHSDFVECAAL